MGRFEGEVVEELFGRRSAMMLACLLAALCCVPSGLVGVWEWITYIRTYELLVG